MFVIVCCYFFFIQKCCDWGDLLSLWPVQWYFWLSAWFFRHFLIRNTENTWRGMGTELVQSMIPLSQIMLGYHLSLFEYISTPLNTFPVTNRYFIAASTQQLSRYLPQVDCRNVSLETKELSKTRFEKVDCTGSTVCTSHWCHQLAENLICPKQKKKHSQTAVQSLKRIKNSPV